ncbi:MAG: hypothetical protein E2591_27655 [Achromobacter sp.]|uniref:hypothetical protein n=1 Tax=Achromobacter TaxID=222 RepID=UPI0012C5131D|nr:MULTISPECIES: hypothetical protein [Achromobacter]MPS81846.1 hypothetical protein [Achromobacter sp.]
MTSALSPSKHATRLVYAIVSVTAAIALSGCGTPSADLRVAPEGLDFDYTVSSDGGYGVVRAFGDQAKTILVLDQPLPPDLKSVPVELPGGVRSSAEVQGNYIVVAGRLERLFVLLPSGTVEVARSTAKTLAGESVNVMRSSGSQADADDAHEQGVGDDGDERDEVESNIDWGTADGARALDDPALHQGGPVPGRPGGAGAQRQGPLPTSVEQLR